MRAPHRVRLKNGAVDTHITNQVSGLSYRSVVPGGFVSAQFTLNSPISRNDPRLDAFTEVYIYDGRNGNILWEGKLAQPGRSAGDQGQVWSLAANGPGSHTLDNTSPLIYIDTRLDQWKRSTLEATLMPASSSVSVGNHPHTSAFDAVICQAGPGVPVVTNARVAALYENLVSTGMELGAVGFSWDAGFSSSLWNVELVVGAYPTYTHIPFSVNPAVAGGTSTEWVTDDFPAGRNAAGVRLVYTGASSATISGDTTWATFANIRVIGRRYSQAGVLAANGAAIGSSVFVRASWVVGDLLGRLLPLYDGAGATLTGDTIDIDQLAYDDPVTPSQVLDDMMALEPSTYWAAWETNASGKYRFEWSTWPTTVRYEATVTDGFDSPAPTFELYNRCRVRWLDSAGRVKHTTIQQTVPELDSRGLTRWGYLDLSDEVGSDANALAAGWKFLLDHRAPSSGGTLSLTRPIRDLQGGWCQPWEVRPGRLIRVRGVEASRLLDDDTRDGNTVFRIVSVQVDGDGTSQLELDMFTQTEQRALVDLSKKRLRR